MERGAGSEGILHWLTMLLCTGRLPSLLVAGACAIVLYGFLVSGDYAVDDVVVRGAEIGDPVQIASATGAFGDSIFEIRPKSIAEQIAAMPFVQEAEVQTHWPSQIVVTVTERVPVIVWRTSDRAFLVDAHGRVLAEASGSADLPVVESDALEISIGGSVDPLRVAAVQAVHAAVGPELDTVTWSERDGLTAQLEDRSIIIFGYPEQFPLKIAVFQEIGTGDAVWSVLDLREPDRPYYE